MDLSLGTALEVLGQEGAWLRVALLTQREGFVRASLVMPLEQQRVAKPTNITSLAQDFLQAPYVWGGVSAWGLDCSGLVQTVFAAHGIALPRDSDQQEACGHPLSLVDAKAADLVFFEGHVGIYLGEGLMIHANAKHMRVTINPVHEVGTVRSVKRVL
jgi:cell wall-associated NlpC family hydrolase